MIAKYKELTLEQAVNRLDRIFDTEQKLRLDMSKATASVEALNKQIESNRQQVEELKSIISSHLQTKAI